MPEQPPRMRRPAALALIALLAACAGRDMAPAPSAGTAPPIRAPLDDDDEDDAVMLATLMPGAPVG